MNFEKMLMVLIGIGRIGVLVSWFMFVWGEYLNLILPFKVGLTFMAIVVDSLVSLVIYLKTNNNL